MITAQTQIKINLPVALKEFLESRARRFGLPIATYVKQLILQDVKDLEYPIFKPSERAIKAYKSAMKNKDRAIRVNDVDQYLKNL